MKRLFAIIACLAVLLAGCNKPEGTGAGTTGTGTGAGVSTPEVTQAEPVNTKDVFSNRDLLGEYDTDGAVEMKLSGESVTITDEGVYILTGTISDGQIIVEADKSEKIQLVFAGVDITCNGSAALYVKSADKVFVTLAEGTVNTLSSTGEFTPDGDVNVDGAIFSRDDITINGKGSLTVTSETGHGVVSKDDLKITGGKITVTASSHALSGKDSVSVAGGEFTLTAGKDGIHSSNDDDATRGNILVTGGSFEITADGDGVDGSGNVEIDGGTINIISGGGSANGEDHKDDMFGGWGRSSGGTDTDTTSRKGLKADRALIITGGVITINSADDSLHSNGDVTVSGGEINAASGDDGIHADGAVTITAGTIRITESYEGIEGKTITIAGGNIDVVSSDDGFNASDGTGDLMGGGMGGGFGGGGFGNKGDKGDKGKFGDQSGDIVGAPGGMPGGNTPGDIPGGNAPGGMPGGNVPGDIPGGDAPDDMLGGNLPGGNAPDGTPPDSQGTTTELAEIYLLISGGRIHVDAVGDGLDSNGAIYVTGGETYVDGPTNSGNGALDYATEAVITGGVVVAVGASGMAENFGTNSTQGSIMYNTSGRSGDVVLRDADGNVLAQFSPSKSYSSVVVSAPGIESGKTYTLEAGGQSVEIEMTSLIYGSGSGMGMGGGGGGGRPGGGRR